MCYCISNVVLHHDGDRNTAGAQIGLKRNMDMNSVNIYIYSFNRFSFSPKVRRNSMQTKSC